MGESRIKVSCQKEKEVAEKGITTETWSGELTIFIIGIKGKQIGKLHVRVFRGRRTLARKVIGKRQEKGNGLVVPEQETIVCLFCQDGRR